MNGSKGYWKIMPWTWCRMAEFKPCSSHPHNYKQPLTHLQLCLQSTPLNEFNSALQAHCDETSAFQFTSGLGWRQCFRLQFQWIQFWSGAESVASNYGLRLSCTNDRGVVANARSPSLYSNEFNSATWASGALWHSWTSAFRVLKYMTWGVAGNARSLSMYYNQF